MTRILALDTSGPYCAVALLSEATVRVSRSEAMSKGQAERLLPMTDDVLEEAGCSFEDVAAIAVCTGPGNFTGIRIAVSAARGFALALECPAIGITALEALAYGQTGRVLATVDARGGCIYAQSFHDGKPDGDAQFMPRENVHLLGSDFDLCRGFEATEIAADLNISNSDETKAPPETYALMALERDWATAPRPAPDYIRQPDAALPTDPPPKII